MIFLVSGVLGSGKTAFAVCQALHCDGRVFANFPISGLSCPFFLLPKSPNDWDASIFTGYRRSTKHPKIIVIIDELPEIADQFSRKQSALLSYLRHSDKIGHTVYIISQRPGHTMKTIRQLAATTYYIFFVLAKRFIVKIDSRGKTIGVPRPLKISEAFGHYDTAEIVSPTLGIKPHFLPLRAFRLRSRLRSFRFALLFFYFLFALLLPFLLLF